MIDMKAQNFLEICTTCTTDNSHSLQHFVMMAHKMYSKHITTTLTEPRQKKFPHNISLKTSTIKQIKAKVDT